MSEDRSAAEARSSREQHGGAMSEDRSAAEARSSHVQHGGAMSEDRSAAKLRVMRLPEDMKAWVESETGATVIGADRQAGGGRKEAWFIDLLRADGTEEGIFMRWDQTDPVATGDPWTVRREAEVYRSLRDTDVPVARFIAMHPTAQVMLATRVHGATWFSHIKDSDEQVAVAKDFIGHLAALHRIDVHDLPLSRFDPDASLRDMAIDQIDEMEALVAFRGGSPEPLLRLALDWLRDNVPDYEGPAVLVQGDTGPGNFMYADAKVTAIVDWELAHYGDPMDDIAWVTLRALQEPFTDLKARFAEYQALSGHRLDLARIKYYRVMGEAKIVTMNHGISLKTRAEGAGGGADVGARLIFGQLHRRLCAEALADVMGLQLPLPELREEPPAGDLDDLFDVVLDQMREVIVPRITDNFALQRTKGMARVLKYLAVASRRGPGFAALELEDLERVLGDRVGSVAEGRALLAQRVEARELGVAEALPVLYNRLARDNELLRGASGVLADRHYFDPI
ncbi:MAG: phosphotransferase family protein [Acidimicrobiia bacterium]